MVVNAGLQKCKERKESNWAKCVAGSDVGCIRREHKVGELIRKNENNSKNE